MIYLSHLPLKKIAKKHKKEILVWVKPRFDAMVSFFDVLEKVKNNTNFPHQRLSSGLSKITRKENPKLIALLRSNFADKNLLNDILDSVAILKDELDNILGGDLNELHRIVLSLNPIFLKYQVVINGKKQYGQGFNFLTKILENVFDYEKFTKKDTLKRWDAYNLANELKISVCPYCNRLYTTTLIKRKKQGVTLDKQKRIRPEFDHYYSKSVYPFLRLSFYNLVPSCHPCNSNLKLEANISIHNHMHPYLEGFQEILEFKTGRTVDEFLDGKKTKNQIKLFPLNNADPIKLGKANSNNSLFELAAIYNTHRDIADEIFEKARDNSKSHIESFASERTEKGNKLFNDPKDVYKWFIGNYMNSSDFYKRPLAKFQYDIAKEAGLIHLINSLKI